MNSSIIVGEYEGKFKDELESFKQPSDLYIVYRYKKESTSMLDTDEQANSKICNHEIINNLNENKQIFNYMDILNNAAVRYLERIVFDYCAEAELKNITDEQIAEIDNFAAQTVDLQNYANSIGLSKAGTRFIAASIFKAANAGGFKTYIASAKAAAFFNRKFGALIGKKIAMKVAAQWTKFVLRNLNMLLWAWAANDILEAAFGADEEKLVSLICLVYLTPPEAINEL